jgi:hypothetical protein
MVLWEWAANTSTNRQAIDRSVFFMVGEILDMNLLKFNLRLRALSKI